MGRPVRRFTFLAAALLLVACGSPSQDASPRDRYRVTVAASASAGDASEANWQRFVDNVKVWAPPFTVMVEGIEKAGPPSGWVTAVQDGRLQMAALPPETAVALVPELAVLSAPGLFASQEEADHVLDKVLLAAFRPLFSAQGLRLLDWIDDDWEDPAARRVYRSGVIVANKDWYDRLTPHDRDVFMQAYGSAGQARADSRAAARGAAGSVPAAETGDEVAASAEAGDHAALIAQAGGQSQQVYDLIQQGKRDFAAR
jgi:TRAP-type C4-dicarboxylate transport system substrate-binding protein